MVEVLNAAKLDDYMLERALREALSKGCAQHGVCERGPCIITVESLRAEARRRFKGMLGLPEALMKDTEAA